jgi:hypothetical protein
LKNALVLIFFDDFFASDLIFMNPVAIKFNLELILKKFNQQNIAT